MHLAVSLLGYAPPARPWLGDYCAGILPPLLARREVTRATLLVTPYGFGHWQHLASERVRLQQVEGLDERKRRRFYAERYILPGMLRELKPDAVFAPLGGALLLPHARYIYRLPSLAYLLEPERFSLLEQLFYGKTIPASCRVADRVVVDHTTLADSAADRIMASRERTRVVPAGMEIATRGLSAAAAVTPVQGLYIVLLGADDDAELPRMLNGLIAHTRLPRGWEEVTFVCLTRQAAALSGTRLLAIEDSPLSVYKDLLRGAQLALCLSTGDSGLTPLRHALGAGLAVIAVDTPAVRNVAGEAASYVPAYELAETASALAVLLADDNQRAELAGRASELARVRTWEQAAQQIAGLLGES